MQTLKPLAMPAASPAAEPVPGTAPAPAGKDEKALQHAAEQFEAMFIRQMLHEMDNATREIAGADSPLHDPISGDLRDYANMAFADSLSLQHAFGISDLIVRQLSPAEPPTRSDTLGRKV